MKNIIVIDSVDDWPLQLPDIQVIDSKEYLLSDTYKKEKNIRIFNICSSYKYQSLGYYVSLLAAARGHKPIPSVSTIQDMKTQSIIKYASEELYDLIQKSLADIKSTEFVLSIYFGKNLSPKYDRLCLHLYKLFNTPFVRAHFVKNNGSWFLRKVGPISAKDIPPAHKPYVIKFAQEYFSSKKYLTTKKKNIRFYMAILYDPNDEFKPSNEKAIKNFIHAAEKLQIECEVITYNDFARLGEFDALFIRNTTAVNHPTYRFARKAEAEGLVVIDDPESILKCTNKVYLKELLEKNHIPIPKTIIVHKDNINEVISHTGLPCVLKKPDSSFSQGVIKVETFEDYLIKVQEMLESSDLVIAQKYIPTEFDWRVTVIDGKPLFVSKYFMPKKHWQIVKKDKNGHSIFGKVEMIPTELAPKKLVKLALECASLIGSGLYGIDIKEVDGQLLVMEINDNPNIDEGYEDVYLKEDLYLRVMEVFLKRMSYKKEGLINYE